MIKPRIGALLLSVLAAASALAAPPTPFTTEVESHFAAWDKNSDGILQPTELDALVVDKNLTGKPAAALGALKAAQRSTKVILPPITLEYLDNYEQQIADRKRPSPNFDRSFTRALKKISSPKRELLSGEKPTLDTCHQGPLGDCYFISVVGAAVARDPAAVERMITTAEGGSFTVKFGDGQHTRVEPLTDAEIALTSTTGDNGLWLPILEKAYGSLRTESLPEDKQSESMTDAIARGGSAAKTIQLLTGHNTDRFSFRPRTPKSAQPTIDGAMGGNKDGQTDKQKPDSTRPDANKPDARNLDGKKPDASKPAPPPIDPELLARHLAETLPKVREHLAASIKDRRLIAAGTPKEGKMPPGVNPNHAYAILGYDAESDTIHLWNPHGNTFTPKGDPGLERGYPTKAGRFSMSLDDFAHVFNGISFETDKPLPPKK